MDADHSTTRTHQVYRQPHTTRPEVICDDYLDIRRNYSDMVRPTPLYRPTPVVRPAPVYMDEYDDLILRRELVPVDRQSAPRGRPVVATWYLYSDDLMRVPTRGRIPRQRTMSPRTYQTNYQRRTCPQRRERTHQKARPRGRQRRVLKRSSEGGEGCAEDESFRCDECNEINRNTITICEKCRTPRSRGDRPPSRCNIHRNDGHAKIECHIVCGFCDLRGSHPGNECRSKEYIKQSFVENKIRRHGVAAENLALSLVTNNGINKISEEEFGRRLRGQPVPPYNRTFEDYQLRNRRPE